MNKSFLYLIQYTKVPAFYNLLDSFSIPYSSEPSGDSFSLQIETPIVFPNLQIQHFDIVPRFL